MEEDTIEDQKDEDDDDRKESDPFGFRSADECSSSEHDSLPKVISIISAQISVNEKSFHAIHRCLSACLVGLLFLMLCCDVLRTSKKRERNPRQRHYLSRHLSCQSCLPIPVYFIYLGVCKTQPMYTHQAISVARKKSGQKTCTMASADTLPHKKEADDDADMFDDATDGPASSTEDGNNNATTTETHEKSVQKQLASNPPPAALPAGWFLKPSQINAPGNYYYFNQDTGECCWELPATASSTSSAVAAEALDLNATALAAAAAVKSILKRAEPTAAETTTTSTTKSSTDTNSKATKSSSSSRKKQKTDDREKHREKHHHHSSSPKEVRVLHILKKHKDSRRPASWRNPKITDTKQKAISDLHELLSILSESSSNPKELRATFEELAKTESDCSSAKRGGDLGFFGRKKMQPAFEKASFGLRVGELTREVVDTSSGVHIILRLA